ncbi:NACHT domain-containing protein [Sorangium sp. So ce726]|uniref:NACHT domain-containing protein n=1 Tax=Sorangium sp. So ce726 TaxID=3133319 RepID=UPI003F622FCE
MNSSPPAGAMAAGVEFRERGVSHKQHIENYLARIQDYCACLPYLSLHDIRPNKTLSETYVALRARDSAAAGAGYDKFGRPITSEISVAEVLADSREGCTVILGDPGSGKSSLLRHLAERAWTAPESIGLRKPHLPLLIPLPAIAAISGPFEKRIAVALEQELSLARAMPAGFFDMWPAETGARWLVLLDALDEVPNRLRASFLRWLGGTLMQLAPNRLVLTTRSSSYREGDISTSPLSHYEILPFAPEQTNEFAKKWFGSEASLFLKGFHRTHVGDLQRTPLLLAIAAKVFSEHHDVPERRARLYENFVNIAIAEARQKGIESELGERIGKVSLFALSRIALHMTESAGSSSESGVHRNLASYFQKALGTSPDESLVDAERFIDVMARRSGLLIRRGRVLGYVHPTIQEYLAAVAITRECDSRNDALWEKYISKWQSRQWREVALFALGILSEQQVDINDIFRAVMPNISTDKVREVIAESGLDGVDELLEPNGALMFATESIRDGIGLNLSEYDRIAGYYLTIVRCLDSSDLAHIAETPSSPFDALRMLRASPSAAQGLRKIARDPAMGGYIRFLAMRSLVYLRETNSDVQLLAQWGIGEKALYPNDATFADVAYSARADIAELLYGIGQTDKALSVLSSLVRKTDGTGSGARGLAIELWMDVVRNLDNCKRSIVVKDLEFLVRDPGVSQSTFDRLMAFLKERKFSWAMPFLERMAVDEGVDDWRRCEAAIALASVGDAERARYIVIKLTECLNDSYARHYMDEQSRRLWMREEDD